VGDQIQEGNHAVYRINPRNIDSLRSDINQKISYENKPLETVKKGEFRAENPTLTKLKLPDYRETSFNDLIASKSLVEGPKQVGEYTNTATQRNEKQNYITGHAVNTSMGDGPDKSKTNFEKAKRESFLNDPTHGISSTNKSVVTNVKSYTCYDNQRLTTNSQYEAPVSAGQNGNYTVDYKDVPLVTLRQLLLENNNQIGVASTEKNSYVFSNDMVLPITNRQTTNNDAILGSTGEIKLNKYFNPNDKAKNTIRENTSHNIISNTVSQDKSVPVYNDDKAKLTSRQFTSHNIVTNTISQDKSVPVYNDDKAKLTTRQFTSHNIVTNTISQDKSVPVYNDDKAKLTTRQYTSHNIITNTVSQDKSVPVYNDDQAKVTIRQNAFHNLAINVTSNEKNNYVQYEDQAKNTIKQTTIFNKTSANITANVNNSYSNIQDNAKPTIKQSTIINIRKNGNVNGEVSMNYTRDLNDSAKVTTRQLTELTKHIGHANCVDVDGTYVRDINDQAKPTIRQNTELTQHIGHANVVDVDGSYVRDLDDKTRPTIKQTTIYTTPGGRLNNLNMGNYTRDLDDTARTTIKQTTHLENYTGTLHGEIEGKISHEAANNMEIDCRREITTFNRTSNGHKDINGPIINEENVRLNDKRILFNYVSHPHKNLDHSVMPTTTRQEIETLYSSSKPIIETSNYYINPYFINTLKNNPLVNDIYHQHV
jgi:hypothetical protein